MFDGRFEWKRSAVSPKDPPTLVEVNVGRMLPPRRLRWGTETPIWARAYGVGGTSTGRLLEWVLSDTGDWWGRVEMTLGSKNGRTSVDVCPLVVPDAIRELTPAEVQAVMAAQERDQTGR